MFRSLVCIALFLMAATSMAATPAIDADVDRLIAIFDGEDDDPMEEALVQLRWAGIPEPRLYEHFLARIRAGNVEHWRRDLLIQALAYSGKKDEAKAQFTRAAQLYLTPSEKAALARMH